MLTVLTTHIDRGTARFEYLHDIEVAILFIMRENLYPAQAVFIISLPIVVDQSLEVQRLTTSIGYTVSPA